MKRSNRFKSLSFFAFCVSLVFTAFAVKSEAQCGVYLKRLSSNVVPAKVIFQRSEDMTGDGIPDLIGMGLDTSDNRTARLLISPANGSGGFGSPIAVNAPAGFNILTYTIGDFDTDVYKDVVLLFDTAPQAVMVYKNNGNGTFTQQTLIQSGGLGGPKYLLDINNDGKGDYIGIFSDNTHEMRYALGNGDGTFGSAVQFSVNRDPVMPGDFNTDGKIDFIAGTDLLTNVGGGIFTNNPNALNISPPFQMPLYIGDMTGDGKPDILVDHSNSTYVRLILLTNLGNGTFTQTSHEVFYITQGSASPWWGDLFVGNFSGNSAPDFLWKPGRVGTTVVYTNNGSGTFTRQDYIGKFNGDFIGDYDGDGKTDSVRVSNAYPSGSGFSPTKLFNEANITVQKNVCNRPGQTKIVDFNYDGQTDYSFWKPANGDWSYKTSPGIQETTFTGNWGLGSFDDKTTPGDFDGDGKTDFAVYRNSTGYWYVQRSSLGWFEIKFGTTGDKPVVGDYDGDTISDIAVWRPSDGNWYVWYMGTQTYSITHFGSDGDKPVPEDFDGDGKTDLAVFRPSTGVWYYLHSTDGNFTAIQWGISTDKPVPADYDGDGRADITVYRESQNLWYILRSYDFSYAAFQYGLAQDVAQPGDYNGDFVFDVGVYRPFSNTWYSSNTPSPTTFGATNVVPTSSILRIDSP